MERSYQSKVSFDQITSGFKNIRENFNDISLSNKTTGDKYSVSTKPGEAIIDREKRSLYFISPTKIGSLKMKILTSIHVKDNYVISILCYADPDEFEKYSNDFSFIIDSLQIDDGIKTSDTSNINWKTFFLNILRFAIIGAVWGALSHFFNNKKK